MDTDAQLDQLERDGYLHLRGALSPEETERARVALNHAREQEKRSRDSEPEWGEQPARFLHAFPHLHVHFSTR